MLIADLEDAPESPCVAQVQDLDGNVLVMGLGESAADAVAQLFEHILPPNSGEYLPPDDGMPGHDR